MPLFRGTRRYPVLAGEEAAFSPLDLAGLVLWLKADAGVFQDAAKTTPAVSDGDVVGAWADQSGNGNDVTQATTANKPLLKLAIQNGLPVLRFDGVNDVLQGALSAALSQPFHVVMVAQLNNANDGNNYSMLDSDDITNRLAIYQTKAVTPNKWAVYAGNRYDDGLTDANWHIFSVLANGASSVWRVDGSATAAGNAGAQNADGITVGSAYTKINDNWDGDIGEIVIYDPSLSAANHDQIENYYSTRWGISL